METGTSAWTTTRRSYHDSLVLLRRKGRIDREEKLFPALRNDPEFRDATDQEIWAAVRHVVENEEEIVEAEVKAMVNREVIRMVNKGELEYDPETDRYRRKPD